MPARSTRYPTRHIRPSWPWMPFPVSLGYRKPISARLSLVDAVNFLVHKVQFKAGETVKQGNFLPPITIATSKSSISAVFSQKLPHPWNPLWFPGKIQGSLPLPLVRSVDPWES